MCPLVEVERAGPERIGETAFDAQRQVGTAPDHLARRRPTRPLRLAPDPGGSAPGEALPTHADAVAQGAATALDEVEVPARRVDNNCAG